jgi:hypothetical protein
MGGQKRRFAKLSCRLRAIAGCLQVLRALGLRVRRWKSGKRSKRRRRISDWDTWGLLLASIRAFIERLDHRHVVVLVTPFSGLRAVLSFSSRSLSSTLIPFQSSGVPAEAGAVS